MIVLLLTLQFLPEGLSGSSEGEGGNTMGGQWLLFSVDLLALFGIYLALNLSLRLQLGYTGIANFGLVLAFTGGAYVGGWLPIRLGMWLVEVDPSLRKT
jgi:ABC-type branched-subunit amino acid transport system permease subunit